MPQSGVQVVEFDLPTADLAQVLRSFAEHRFVAGAGMRTVLMPLDRVGSGDVVWHPVSHRALAPDEILSVSGTAALESFLGYWLPVPYLRFLGNDETGNQTFDQGPENWARVFIAASPADLRDKPKVRIALAFDTRLEPSDRSGERRYLAPNADDALFGATFKMVAGAHDLARFAGRPWLDAWLRQLRTAHRSGSGGGGTPRPSFELDHVARYLVLIEVLDLVCAMPEVRFIDTLSRRWPASIANVDLVLDIGNEDTAAVLVERDEQAVASPLANSVPLPLRSLSQPVVTHAGTIPTRIEFAPPPFGEAGLSRLSGRPDAFLWPSLVRIGHEAAGLSLRPSATVGVTGQASLPSLLAVTAVADDAWRLGTDGDDVASLGPVVSGALLAHLAEDGTPLASAGDTRAPAVRPRFAPSSLLTFFLVELVLHAVTAINAVDAVPDARRPAGVRRLKRIVVTVPAGMSPDERGRVLAHASQAVDLVWRALGWDGARDLGAPPRPELMLGPGTEVAAQMFAVRREIAARYGNDPHPFVEAWCGDRGGDGAIRVASLDLGREALRAVIVDYTVAADGNLAPLQAATDRWDAGGDHLAEAVAAVFLKPAIAAALSQAGMKSPELFMSRALDTTTARPSSERNLARRLESKVLRPAAEALVRISRELPPAVASGLRTYSLRLLVARGGGRLQPQARDFDALARRDGADGFVLEDVVVRLSQRQLDAAIRGAVAPSLARAAELAARHRCNLVVVGGRLARIPSVIEDLVASMPLEPGRILRANDDEEGQGSGAGAVASPLGPGRVAGLAGAYLAGLDAPGFEALKRVVKEIATDAILPLPVIAPATAPALLAPALGHGAAGLGAEVPARASIAAERIGGLDT